MTTLGIDPCAPVFGGPNARVPKSRTRSTTSGNEPVVRED